MKKIDLDSSFVLAKTARQMAAKRMFKELHVLEVWMPQPVGRRNCNLRCGHCYVPTGGIEPEETLSVQAISDALARLMSSNEPFCDRWDVVFPGMEPLLPANREYLSVLMSAAVTGHAKSIGMTTNGTLLRQETQRWLVDSGLTTLNISLDGNREVHDRLRGSGAFDAIAFNASSFCRHKGTIKVVTNKTITSANVDALSSVAHISRDWGCEMAAFHPFESAVNAHERLSAKPDRIVQGVEKLLAAWKRGETGSVVLEFEPSTAGVFFRLYETGIFDHGFDILEDETRFRFLRAKEGDREFLVDLIFYPHHFVRTVRIMPDGSLSSCRRMARHGWRGVGDVSRQSLEEIRVLPETVEAAAEIWEEYYFSLASISPTTIERWLVTNSQNK
jgi:MoaA/NifB/PqqE/SkfB family radical SAM enzyme